MQKASGITKYVILIITIINALLDKYLNKTSVNVKEIKGREAWPTSRPGGL